MKTFPSSAVTRIHLRLYGLSNYQVRKILENIQGVRSSSGFKEYPIEEVKTSMQKRLSNPRIKESTRKQLDRVLFLLNGESNIVEVDFLKKLSPEQRLDFLYRQLEQLSEKEEKIRQETNALIQKARQVVGTQI